MTRTLAALAIACGLAVVPRAARADDGVHKVALAVGETVEREVGYAIGVQCDDLEVVAVTMRSRNAKTNVLAIRGKRAGKTLCRAGTDPNAASVVFEITVTPAKRPPKSR